MRLTLLILGFMGVLAAPVRAQSDKPNIVLILMDNLAVPWRRWGPYVSERQWGTVREDYSESGNAWDYFSHDQARPRAYRCGEDGLHCWPTSTRMRRDRVENDEPRSLMYLSRSRSPRSCSERRCP